jgi:hypothetical protein
MKTMTCSELGGPCDARLEGATADAVIKAQDRHLEERVSGGDATHEPAWTAMKGRWRHPISGMGWAGTAGSSGTSPPSRSREGGGPPPGRSGVSPGRGPAARRAPPRTRLRSPG